MADQDKFITLKKAIFNLIRIKNSELYQYEKNIEEKEASHRKVKEAYDNANPEKYGLQFLFISEQHSLTKFPLESKVNNDNLYLKRLERFIYYVNALESKREIKITPESYKFNDAVQKEALSYYETKIGYINQKIRTIKVFNNYLLYLKSNDLNEYNKKVVALPSNEEIEELVNSQKKLEQDKLRLIKCFKEAKFKLDDIDILSNTLIDPNIISVVCKMYPNFVKNKEVQDNIVHPEFNKETKHRKVS